MKFEVGKTYKDGWGYNVTIVAEHKENLIGFNESGKSSRVYDLRGRPAIGSYQAKSCLIPQGLREVWVAFERSGSILSVYPYEPIDRSDGIPWVKFREVTDE